MVYLYIILGLIFLGIPILRELVNLYPEYLWFFDLGYQEIFIKFLGAKWFLALGFGVVTFIFVLINLKIALWVRKGLKKEPQVVSDSKNPFSTLLDFDLVTTLDGLPIFKWIPYIVSGVVAVLFSSIWFVQWDKVLLFFNSNLVGTVDPIFNKDIGFYLLQLPFLKLLQAWLSGVMFIVILGCAIVYLSHRAISINGFKIRLKKGVNIHLSFLFVIFFLLLAWSFRLGMFEVLISPKGAFFGAGYTDVHAYLLGDRALIMASLLIALIFFKNIFKQGIMLIIEALLILLAIVFVMKGIYPSLLQQFVVSPNEIEKERPYIQNNIDFTQKAYGLDKLIEYEFKVGNNLTAGDLLQNEETISNIRLWDHRPLLKTLSQLQAIRLYYDFIDVDIDRYWVNGKYQQVMLSAREMDSAKLAARAQNWINQHLTFTHGKGLVMMPVNKVSPEGQPEFYIYDIPPKNNSGLALNNSSVYFGEATNHYIITNTKTKELDYPAGEENVYATYDGNKGIKLSSFWRKLVFALKYQELKILISGYIQPDSKIFYDRNILTRVNKIAPFLLYDNDPYLVLIDGSLYWFLDAFVVSDKYPYSEPFYGKFNYLKNSVKVIINAYTGQTDFYIVDRDEPLIKAYSAIFPSLFKPVADLDDRFKAHFRYPEDLFSIQAKIYSAYHMNEPQVFYNQEDLWVIPNETFEDDIRQVQPYYVNMKLPEDKQLTFRLMLPFTPSKKNNLIGWMSANCDQEDYGKLTVYKLPKDQLVYGPMQIESRIDQDTEISKQLALWGQQGSRVVRGNLLVIPINDSFLYVEPLYLQATQSKFPELKRIILAYDNLIVMETTFEEALVKLFGSKYSAPSQAVIPQSSSAKSVKRDSSVSFQRASQVYQQAIQAQKDLDWKTYGERITELGSLLQELSNQGSRE